MLLKRYETRWAVALLEAVLPFAENETDDVRRGLSTFVDDFVRSAPAQTAWAFRGVVWGLNCFGPLLVMKRLRTAQRLSVAERAELLDSLSHKRAYLVRESANLLKAVACIGRCTDAELRAHIRGEAAANRDVQS
ncbi:MAG: hypothetical protein KC561_10715 [Myxococcales bacterium]|nr:hypothetical protein [Myxococcales bacterium]